MPSNASPAQLLSLAGFCILLGGIGGYVVRDAMPPSGPRVQADEKPRAESKRDAAPASPVVSLVAPLADFTETLDAAGIRDALAKAESLPDRMRASSIDQLVRRWAVLDPLAAALYAGQEPDHDRRLTLLREVGYEWARTAPDAALAYAIALPVGEERAEMRSCVFGVLGRTNPGRAFALWRETPPGERESLPLGEIFENWSAHDLPGAAAAVLTLPPGEIRDTPLQHIVSAWAKTDPQAALAWAALIPERRSRVRRSKKSPPNGRRSIPPRRSRGLCKRPTKTGTTSCSSKSSTAGCDATRRRRRPMFSPSRQARIASMPSRESPTIWWSMTAPVHSP